jgi:MFS family permease
VLLAVPAVGRRPVGTPARGSYREVARDGAFVRFVLLNLAVVAAAIALLNSVFPVYATAEAGVSTRVVGALFLVNALVIVAAQLPVARRQEGRRRTRALAVMSALFAVSWLLVLAAGSGPAVPLLAAAIVVFSLAECLYDAVQGPLTADLAGGRLTGRYMAVNGFSWQLGFIVGPAAGAAVLGAEPQLLWPLAAGVCLLAAVGAVRLEPRLPAEHRRTRPSRQATGESRPAPAPCGAGRARRVRAPASVAERARDPSRWR